MQKILTYLFVFFMILSCTKKQDVVVVEKTGILVESLGATNFGGVILGNYKDAALRITNNEKSNAILDFSKIVAPFSVQSKSISCASGVLLPASSCVISIRFQPVAAGNYLSNLSVANSLMNKEISGVALTSGYLTIDTSTWDVGSLIAGTLRTKEFYLTNNGDLTVKMPTFTFPDKITLGINNCGSYIGPKITCKIVIESRLEIKGSYSEYLSGISDDGGSVGINFTANISAGEPSGLVGFSQAPTSMSSAGAEFIFQSNPIKDAYGNVVPLHTSVNIAGNSLVLLLDGNTYFTDSLGVVSFRVRTRTIKGTGAVSLTTGQASGSHTFPIIAGNAFGEITATSVLSEIPANGISQVIVNTDIITDQYNNIVEDGTPIIFDVSGTATVSTGLDPKTITSYTINGVARVMITSGTVAEISTLTIKSGPIIDPFNNIIGYSANGSVSLNFVPGVADGLIPVVSNFNKIYADSNPPPELNIPYRTHISLGPIKDSFGNIVKTNSEVSLVLSNGFNDTISGLPTKIFKLYTDAAGMAQFELIGAGLRGNISVNATAAFAVGSTAVWALQVSKTHFVRNSGRVALGYRHFNSLLFPSANTNWATVKNPNNIESQDNTYYGYLKDSNHPATTFQSNQGIPYFTWDCLYTASDFLFINFCMQPDGLLSPMYKYDRNHNLRTDFPAGNTEPELIANTAFNSDKQLQFWINEVDGGKSYGIKYDGLNQAMEIDNSLAVDPNDNNARKKYAYSDWIPVNPLKKYALKFTVKQQFGDNIDKKKVEVGVAEATESITTISNPSYSFEPVILRDDVLLSGAYIPSNINMVYKPKDGTTYIRLYFSTVGSGNSTLVRLDDVSLKVLNTQNIHDSEVTEGPSLAYIPGSDSLLMFGGDTIHQTGIDGNYAYSGYSSNRNTFMNRMLDVSTSVIVDNYNTPELTGLLGSMPSARSHSSLVQYDNNVLLFGGFNNQGAEGSAFNDTYVLDGLNKNWINKNITPDNSQSNPEVNGKPSARYGNGLVYVDSIKKIFIGGGYSQSEDPEVWNVVDDLWSIDASTAQLSWNKECDNCGLVSTSGLTNLANYLRLLFRFPNDIGNQNIANYVNAEKNIKRNKLIWHPPTQKIYSHSPESSGLMKMIDPFLSIISTPPAEGFKELENSFQIVFNELLGRTFSYKRGSSLIEDSKLYYWDMNIDEKQFIKARFNYDVKAKETLKKISFNIYAYGQTKTFKDFGSVDNNGVLAYIFNHTTSTWILKGSNVAIDSGSLNGPISFTIEDDSILNYISSEGNVDVLLTTRGRPGMEGSEPLMGNDLDFIDVGNNSTTLVDYKVLDVSEQASSTFALLDNNTIVGWGKNDLGQLGFGSTSNQVGSAVGSMGNNLHKIELFDKTNPINSALTITNIYSGENHSCAIFSNNRAKCWGSNNFGQTGYQNNTSAKTNIGDVPGELSDALPFIDVGTTDGTENTGPAKVLKLSLGENHTCAIIEQIPNNKVKCWGKKTEGQLGIGSIGLGSFNLLSGNSTPSIYFKTSIYDGTLLTFRQKNAIDLISGSIFNCAVMEDYSIYCWGDNSFGQLGLNHTTAQFGATTPAETEMFRVNVFATDIQSIVAGSNHWCMYYEYGVGNGYNTLCIGKNSSGQLGIGNTNDIGDTANELATLNFIDWGTGVNPIKLTAGKDYSCALLSNGRIKCYGSNLKGVIGAGTSILNTGTSIDTLGDNNPFIDLGSVGNNALEFKSVHSGFNSNSACGILMDNTLKCWGDNSFGQLGLEDRRNRGLGYPSTKGTTEIQLDYIESEEIF